MVRAKKDTRKPPGRTPSKVFAGRMREVRKAKNWTQQDLAEELASLGHKVDRTTISHTESGARTVQLDDVMAFATALGVCPLHLIVPTTDDEHVVLAPEMVVRAAEVRRWFRGRLILRPGVDDQTYLSQVPEREFNALQIKRLRTLVDFTADLVDSITRDQEVENIDNSLQVLRIIEGEVTTLTRALERERQLLESRPSTKKKGTRR